MTAGAPAGLRLTPIVGPQGWLADGADIAMVDIEVVDAGGRRVPTDISDLTFTHSGAGTWIGGYNSGLAQSAYPNQGVFKDALKTDGGINRILVRSGRTAGTFTIKVSRPGLADANVTLTSQAFPTIQPRYGLAAALLARSARRACGGARQLNRPLGIGRCAPERGGRGAPPREPEQ